MGKYNFKVAESWVLDFWKKNQVYQKQKTMKTPKAKNFYFLQGPPYTTGSIHLGTAWNNVIKDIVIRYRKMKGENVWDRAGWDMHGLPAEREVMKELDLKEKEEIQKYGVSKFNKKCREMVVKKMKEMTSELKQMGVFMEFENPYMTLKNDYIETVWWLLKQADKQKRVYKGKKVMTWCANCGTNLAKHELEYETDEDESIFLKFPVVGKKDEYLVIWTTTPWTIPFNLAVMVNPELDYVRAKVGDETWIVAKGLVNVLMGALGKKYKISSEFKGKELEGVEYVPPFWEELNILHEIKGKHKWAFRVLLSEEYVDLSAGSGLVHTAPGSGPEDQEVGKRYGLPAFNELNEDGEFSSKMGKFTGLVAKKDDAKFIKELEDKKVLLMSTKVEHEYPHCWRCHEPVIFRATEQWFMKVEDLKDKMKQLNKGVNWIPDWAGSGSFKSWLDNLKDNSITRQRFWGTPMPLWICQKCKKHKIIGSVKELKSLGAKVPKDLHKPAIDKVTIKCSCGGVMKKIPDIVDVWIDSGVASFASLHYPKKQILFKQFWPADFITEMTEQIRLWFYTLFLCSTIATRKAPYKNVYVHGRINDAQGRKMSKSLGNFITPDEVTGKYGTDTFRYYMPGASNPAQEMKYNFNDVRVKFRNLEVLWNTASYLVENSRLAKINPSEVKIKELNLIDKYMISKMNSTIKQVTKLYEEYKINEIPWAIESLFLELSRWYIKTTRKEADEPRVLKTIYDTLLACLKLFAPVAPFITEAIYQAFRKEFNLKGGSIHLKHWPKPNLKSVNKNLEKEMEKVQQAVSMILSAREKLSRGIRWPVRKATVVTNIKSSQEAVLRHKELIKKLTNTWELEVEPALSGAEYRVKADYAVVGPKFGAETGKIIGKLSTMSPESIIRHLEQEGRVKFQLDGKNYELDKEDLIIEETLPKNIVGLKERKLAVYLDKTETKEMRVSGIIREVTRKIQALRKKAGLSKEQKINLEVSAPADLTGELMKYEDEIRDKVGAEDADFVAQVSKKHKDEFAVDGKKISIGFDVV